MQADSAVAAKATLPRNSYIFSVGPHPAGNLVGRFENSAAIGDGAVLHQLDDIAHAKESGYDILILGHCYNPFSGELSQEVASQLLCLWVKKDNNAFYDYLGEISGRFVILLAESDGKLNVWGDACGTLPVCYHNNDSGIYLSSHAHFIKEAAGLQDDPLITSLAKTKFYNLGIRHCPADLTEVEGVRMLTPNLQLSYESGSVEISRIFPRAMREERPDDKVVREVSQALKSSIQCLLSYKKPVLCALSGGVDSRISLAATKGERESIAFFTFAGEGNASRDLECTRLLGETLSLDFSAINLPSVSEDRAFFNTYRCLQGETRWPNAKETLQRLTYFGERDAFEIRSSVSEVARSFIKRKFHVKHLKLTPSNMVPLYKRVPFSKKWHSKLENEFNKWMEKSEFKEVSRLGYDWLDFYYWEHRVGTWQSLVMQDADYYTNPTVVFNNRKVLAMFLSAPEKFRETDELQKRVMLELDMDSLDVPLVKNFGKKAVLRELAEFTYLALYRSFVRLFCRKIS